MHYELKMVQGIGEKPTPKIVKISDIKEVLPGNDGTAQVLLNGEYRQVTNSYDRLKRDLVKK